MSYLPRKRPRTNTAVSEDIWGDDLTEDQLEELDVIASQAYSQAGSSKNDPPPNTQYPSPRNSRFNKGNQTLKSKESYTLKTNYISGISGKDKHTDNFIAPSDSLYEHSKSRSFSPSLSKDKISAPTYAVVSHLQQEKEDLIRKLQDELELEKIKNKKLEEVKFAYTGEVTLLRESREQIERQLEEERHKNSLQESKLKKEHEEQISQLQKRISTSQTEFQFQAQELLKLQQKCKSLELHKIKNAKATEETNFVSTKNSFSPQKAGHSFLSKFAANFQSDGSSPKRPCFTEVAIQTESLCETKDTARRKCPLLIRVPKGLLPQSQQVVHILQRLSPGSLISGRLFHSFPDNFRESSASLMSPVSLVRPAVKKEWESHNPVNSCSIFSAVQGISELLDTSISRNVPESLKTDGCLRLLPLIEEQLTLYTDAFCCSDLQKNALGNLSYNSFKTSPSYFSSNSTTSRHSMPSWSSCETRHLEENAANALYLLGYLVRLDNSVGNYLFSSSALDKTFINKNASSRKSMDFTEQGTTCDAITSYQSVLIKREGSFRPGELSSNSAPESKSSLSLLDKISFLCSPSKLKLMGNHITRKLVEVLLAIAETAELNHLQRFNPLLKIGFFSHFLKSCDNVINIQLVLCILKALSASSNTNSLFCNKQDTCIFQCISDLCYRVHSSFVGSDVTHLIGTILDFLIEVVEHQPSAIPFGDQTDCDCDSELIQKIIIVLREEAEEYLCSPEPKRLLILKKGTVLLYNLKNTYKAFLQHRSGAENSYVYLICHLAKIFNQEKKDGFSDEAFAIQHLWDFAQDHSDEFTRGISSEIPMEISQINIL